MGNPEVLWAVSVSDWTYAIDTLGIGRNVMYWGTLPFTVRVPFTKENA
jgi:hypothetical protein